MKSINKYLGLAIALSLLAGSALAATYIEDDFSTVWEIDSEPVTGSPAGTVDVFDIDSDTDSDIRVQTDGPGSATDTVFGDTDNDILALGTDLTSYAFGGAEGSAHADAVSFHFWSDSGGVNPSPGTLSVYFRSGSTYWRYTVYDGFDSDLSLGWNAFSVSMWEVPGWEQVYGSAGFETALGAVDELGIEIGYTGETGQEYGLDQFRLHYPEPGTYAVLAFALMSLGVTFRGKLRIGLKGLFNK